MTRARDVANVLSTATSLATDTETAAAISSHNSSITHSPTSSSVSSNQTLIKNNKYFVDTSAARTLTMPASATIGDIVEVYDATGTAYSYNITVASNSLKINGSVQNYIIDINGAAVIFTYTGSSYGWKVK